MLTLIINETNTKITQNTIDLFENLKTFSINKLHFFLKLNINYFFEYSTKIDAKLIILGPHLEAISLFVNRKLFFLTASI